ncbi:hypothetical protein B4119_4090 [Parageobacillus caldoxylosilyticus]|uniref:Uncharacterized protein n=1 Tax=Saccharococcus caldoxylosilyticus TaxID=81408 RepID=A0A150LVI0_9BACL|nr:hypothetical protein B4119_4090 [Parageobacillus caldoxylosilyticus]
MIEKVCLGAFLGRCIKKMQQAKNAFYFLSPSQVRPFLCLTPL